MPPPRIAFKHRAQEEKSHGDEEEGRRKREEAQVSALQEASAVTQQAEASIHGGMTQKGGAERTQLEEGGRREKTQQGGVEKTQQGRVEKTQLGEGGGGGGGERRKQRDYEVFIGGLDRDTTERDIVKVFRDVGEVVEVRLVRRSFLPHSKGFAFVRFATVEQATKAATELRYVQMRGRSCGVTRSNNHETLHVGNICTSWTKDDLVKKLSVFKLENLEEVHLMEDPLNRGKNRGYAFLDFSTHMDALAACCKLQKQEIFLGTDVRADIAFSRSVEPAEEIMSRVRSVFLDGLPATWDEKCVRLHFEKFGEIENVQLACNMPTAKRKDFGFVNYRTRQAALNCIEKINKTGIWEGNEKVLVKASLKKPLLKKFTQPVGSSRGYSRRDSVRSGSQWQYEDVRPYSSRSMRSQESMRSHEYISRHRSPRTRDLSPYFSREAGYSYMLSSVRDKYDGQTRRHYVRQLQDVAESSSRSRDEYHEGDSSSKLALGRYRDIPSSYKELPRSYYYDDESDEEVYYVYESEYSPYESRDLEYFEEHPTYSGQKRRYSDIDDDMFVTSSMLRRKRNSSRSDYELDSYVSREVSKYDRYTRVMPEENTVYDRVEYTRSRYGTQYLSSRDVIRSYH